MSWQPATLGDSFSGIFGRSKRERSLKLVADRIERKRKEEASKQYGGIQKCPWCNQWVQLFAGWFFDSKTEPEWDVLHCGNCKGTSYWRFELGMIYFGPRTAPPIPKPPEYSRPTPKFLGFSEAASDPAAERTKADSQALNSIEQPYQSKIPTQPQGEGEQSP